MRFDFGNDGIWSVMFIVIGTGEIYVLLFRLLLCSSEQEEFSVLWLMYESGGSNGIYGGIYSSNRFSRQFVV